MKRCLTWWVGDAFNALQSVDVWWNNVPCNDVDDQPLGRHTSDGNDVTLGVEGNAVTTLLQPPTACQDLSSLMLRQSNIDDTNKNRDIYH